VQHPAFPGLGSTIAVHPATEVNMAQEKLDVDFVHIVFSPKGHVEGFMAHADGANAQFVIDKHDAKAAEPSPKGPAEHAVYELARITRVDGSVPKKAAATSGYSGKVARLNFARHGAPNGYVLDSGHFIHVRPDGCKRLKLKVGDAVQADGDACWLATDGGWAVEAVTVNGKRLI
jgi:hypothetical protein